MYEYAYKFVLKQGSRFVYSKRNSRQLSFFQTILLFVRAQDRVIL
jgi:hypothetical protein